MPSHPKTVSLTSFNGLNNINLPERTDPKYLKEAMNIDIDRSGGIRKRKGFQKVLDGSFHSLWSNREVCYAVRDGNLVRINSNYSTDLVLSDVGDNKLTYEELEGKVYFTSERDKGIIEGTSLRNFGIDQIGRAHV